MPIILPVDEYRRLYPRHIHGYENDTRYISKDPDNWHAGIPIICRTDMEEGDGIACGFVDGMYDQRGVTSIVQDIQAPHVLIDRIHVTHSPRRASGFTWSNQMFAPPHRLHIVDARGQKITVERPYTGFVACGGPGSYRDSYTPLYEGASVERQTLMHHIQMFMGAYSLRDTAGGDSPVIGEEAAFDVYCRMNSQYVRLFTAFNDVPAHTTVTRKWAETVGCPPEIYCHTNVVYDALQLEIVYGSQYPDRDIIVHTDSGYATDLSYDEAYKILTNTAYASAFFRDNPYDGGVQTNYRASTNDALDHECPVPAAGFHRQQPAPATRQPRGTMSNTPSPILIRSMSLLAEQRAVVIDFQRLDMNYQTAIVCFDADSDTVGAAIYVCKPYVNYTSLPTREECIDLITPPLASPLPRKWKRMGKATEDVEGDDRLEKLGLARLMRGFVNIYTRRSDEKIVIGQRIYTSEPDAREVASDTARSTIRNKGVPVYILVPQEGSSDA